MTGENSKIFKLLSSCLSQGSFLPNDAEGVDIIKDCLELFERDNICTVLDNSDGGLCSTYPAHLIIPIKQKIFGGDTLINDDDYRGIVDLVQRGRFARTRGRFPTPVLLVGEKFICRSSTLARSTEIYARTGFQYLTQGETATPPDNSSSGQLSNHQSCKNIDVKAVSSDHLENGISNGTDSSLLYVNGELEIKSTQSLVKNGYVKKGGKKSKMMQSSVQTLNGSGRNKEWLLDKMRNTDIDLLRALRVNTICDFMVEKKKVKYGMNVTSSEKVDRLQRYSYFDLMAIPYPGCEFFADYSQNNYTGVGLKFDWSQQFVDAELQMPDNLQKLCDVRWMDYMHWDLIKLTQNYLILLLNCLFCSSSSGILLHCISGWDRTPLFISLIRLSLWADGLIHQSLNAEEIVYLTLSYDWLLFSHQFADRIQKNEEIMHFCFDFLNFIVSEEYSLLPRLSNHDNTTNGQDCDGDDMFLFENDSKDYKFVNGHSTKKENPTQSSCCNHVTVNPREEVEDSNFNQLEDHFSNALDINLEEARNCLENVVGNVCCELETCNGELKTEDCCFGGNRGNAVMKENHDGVAIEATSQILNGHSSPVAILPVSVEEHFSVPEEVKCNDSDASDMLILNGTSEMSNVFSPLSALSSSFETAKMKMNLTTNPLLTEPSQKGLSNSMNFPANEGSFQLYKSEPIAVPIHCGKSVTCTDCNNSVGSSQSNTGTNTEPGSSWQLISPLAHESNGMGNSYVPKCANYKGLFKNICNGGTDATVLKSKLMKRRERLESASSAMIPAYCAVVQQQKQKLEQSGPFSTIMGHIAQMVKRR